jgi:sugar phosphate isomerase/epimerase
MKLTRREMILGGAATALSLAAPCDAAVSGARMSVEGYIFQQYMAGKKEKLADGLDEIFSIVRGAGFHHIELNDGYFGPDLRDRVAALVESNGLTMPSIYVGGAMHEEALADATIAKSLDLARLYKKVGCQAVVGDPSPKQGGAEKTDAELAVQATMLNKLGKALADEGFQYWVHNHDAEMRSNAREWWSNLKQTDPQYVWMCMDLDWVHQGDQDPLTLLRAAGKRAACLHLRNSTNKLWLESLTDGDIDYRAVAAYLRGSHLQPLLMVELAYRPNTTITRPLEEDLRLSRLYAEQIFKVKA